MDTDSVLNEDSLELEKYSIYGIRKYWIIRVTKGILGYNTARNDIWHGDIGSVAFSYKQYYFQIGYSKATNFEYANAPSESATDFSMIAGLSHSGPFGYFALAVGPGLIVHRFRSSDLQTSSLIESISLGLSYQAHFVFNAPILGLGLVFVGTLNKAFPMQGFSLCWQLHI